MKGTYVELSNKVLILLTVDWMSSMAAVWAEFFPYSWRPLPRPVWKLDVSSSRKMYPQDSSDISTTKMISRMDEYCGRKRKPFCYLYYKITQFRQFIKYICIHINISIWPTRTKIISIGFSKYIRYTITFFINGNFQSTGAVLYCR